MEQTLPLLFLINPSPTQTFCKISGKKIVCMLGSNPILLSNNFKRQSEALTTLLFLFIIKCNIQSKVYSEWFWTYENFIFFPRLHPFVFRREWEKVVNLGPFLKTHSITLFSLLFLSNFHFHFLNITTHIKHKRKHTSTRNISRKRVKIKKFILASQIKAIFLIYCPIFKEIGDMKAPDVCRFGVD